MTTVTALLPMKGHSERVPNKNLRPMCGQPLFFHVAGALQACDRVERIVINTDSEAIAEAARARFSKAVIHWRPEAIRGDMVSMNLIIADDMSRCPGEHFLQTHATNPLLTLGTVDRAVAAYFEGLGRFDSLFSVNRLQTRLYWESGEAVNHDPAVLLRTQDLPPVFEENSLLFLFNRASFAASDGKRIGVAPQMFVTPPAESVDIDEEHDFVLAETLMGQRNQNRNTQG
jgi:CMP-N-acetylneuraminic acid synthetase